jgi:hypothetical protein
MGEQTKRRQPWALPGAPADSLEQEDTAQRAWYTLCGQDHNPDTGGHWREWQHLLGDGTPAPFLPASEVVTVGEEAGLTGWAGYMRARYRL